MSATFVLAGVPSDFAEGPSARLAMLLSDAQHAMSADLEAARSALKAALSIVGGAPPAARRSGGLAPWQERKLAAFVEDRLDSSISVDDLAVVAGLSASYLGRAFKASFGESPQVYVLARRLRRARRLMQDASLPLSEVAARSGFADQAHFSRQFRRAHGVSPNRWRRRFCEMSEPAIGWAA